jgi:hypothetical protein
VLEVSPLDVRHFHTVLKDPYRSRTWYASSGDRDRESRVWHTEDNGDCWIDVTLAQPELELPLASHRRQLVFRFTDAVIAADSIWWGADDYLGGVRGIDPRLPLAQRTGARLFRSPKTQPLQPVDIGYVGDPVRKIVDVGPGWFIMTEAKQAATGLRPAVLFLDKTTGRLTDLLKINNFRAYPTGFTYSKGSASTRDGTFFTFRNSFDALDGGEGLLRWDVAFYDGRRPVVGATEP